MPEKNDEVRGIDKFFPTQRSILLFWSIPVSSIAIFWQSSKLVKSLFPGLPNEYSWVGVVLLVLASVAFTSLILIAELCVYASPNKHRVTRHYKYYAPEMNIKWLLANTRPKHCLFLVLIFLGGYFAGNSL